MGWASHLKNAGLTIKATDVPDLTPIRTENGAPKLVFSCHTALVDGDVMEGLVPVEDIERLV